MENYIRSLRAFIAANPLDFGDSSKAGIRLSSHYPSKPLSRMI